MTGRGPRRQVLDSLDSAANRLKWLKRQWTVARTVYVSPAERQPGDNAFLRLRESHEYPESQAEAWRQLHQQAGAAIAELTAMREYAAEQYRRCTTGPAS